MWQRIGGFEGAVTTMPQLAPHVWLKEYRQDKGIRQEDVERFTSALGARSKISQSHLSKIERGNAPLEGLGAERLDALRQALKVSPEVWVEHTGLVIVTKQEQAEEEQEETPAPNLPASLLEAAEVYGARIPALRNLAWQKYLVSFRPRGAKADTAEEWLDLYRDLSKHGIKPPGGN